MPDAPGNAAVPLAAAALWQVNGSRPARQSGSASSIRPSPSLSRPSLQVASPGGPSIVGVTSVDPSCATFTNDSDTVTTRLSVVTSGRNARANSTTGTTPGSAALQNAGSGL